jgi:valyl-tRNA synthetase
MDIKYNAQETEQQLRAQWQKESIYSIDTQKGPLYSIDTPPPTVSGSLHIGHIFSYTQTDIIARYKRLSGFSVFYPFGFDDNGLPTEKFIEKKCDVRAHELGRSKFIELCLEQTKESEEEFKNLWQQMGLSVDWKQCYSTISKEVRRLSQLSFLKLYKDGYIYRQAEPALYCTSCRTTVAQAELDDAEAPSFFNDIAFKDSDGNDLIIATTRPELLYSCGALLYNSDDKRYTHLNGKMAIVPIFNTRVPIYADPDVAIDKGTGLVMVCTFGDQTDIGWFKKHKLLLKLSIGIDGRWLPQTGPLAGLRVKEAREKIVQELEAAGALRSRKAITHAISVHERCGTPIEYTVLTQWFIKILEYKKQFLNLADKIEWYPEFMKSRYVNWVENTKWDWCISRQRFYGIPFPVWHCKKCNTILLPDEKNLPIDPQETKYPKTCSCGSSDIVPDTDVMDTWNTSSITPYICANLFKPSQDPFAKNDFIPMGMRPQAHDIIRTWAFYTIIKVWMHNKEIPWNEIVISGHVLSDKKEKISKSKANNPLAPENLLKAYCADAIRYWTASGSLGHDMSFSDAQLKNGQRLVTKLWNSFRFAQPHIENFVPADEPQNLGIYNEWILTEISQLFESYQNYFDKHEFGLALQQLEKFFWSDFCDNYIELIKNQLFNPHEYSEDELYATKWTLYQIGLRILQLYAPYIPYATDSIYLQLYKKTVGEKSIHITKFAAIQENFDFKSAQQLMKHILHIVGTVRKLKTDQQLSLKVTINTLNLFCEDSKLLDQIKLHEQLIKGVTQAQTIAYSSQVGNSELRKMDEQVEASVYINQQ